MSSRFDPTDKCTIKIPEKGVEIFLPTGFQNKIAVSYISSTDWETNLISITRIKVNKEEYTEYTPYRGVINIEVIDEFSTPIKIKVYFTLKEFMDVQKDIRALKLAFLPKGSNVWKPFEEGEEKHNLKRYMIHQWPEETNDNNAWYGYFTAEFSEWGDPSVSVGK